MTFVDWIAPYEPVSWQSFLAGIACVAAVVLVATLLRRL